MATLLFAAKEACQRSRRLDLASISLRVILDASPDRKPTLESLAPSQYRRGLDRFNIEIHEKPILVLNLTTSRPHDVNQDSRL